MDTLLLATKLSIPPSRHVMRRERLVGALEQGIASHKLILLSAPAGYGKTTLLADWAQASQYPVAWLSVSQEDNVLDRFLCYLLAAWEHIEPDVRNSPLGLLLSASEPVIDAVLSAFINVASQRSDHLVLVLDDYHLIDDPSIHQALAFLLDHLPPTLHFILATRAEPPLPLARYRARRELNEFRTDDLQFVPEETADFLNRLMRLDLSPEELVVLHTRLEGWIAGLQLVALSHQRHRTAAEHLVVTGKQRFIADYLSEDVLAHLPDNLRHFLLQTSILEYLCGSLCDAVTEGEGAQELLEALERANLFLVSLDDQREWFRYHRLFADVLHEELMRRSPAVVIQLHRRAARWYLAHDLPEQASAHAVAGDDVELVIQIGKNYVSARILRGELKLLERWVDSLPERWCADYTLLGLARAATLIFAGAFEACARLLDTLEQRLAPTVSEDTRWQLAWVTSFRCSIACMQNDVAQAEIYADLALRDLPEEDLSIRADTYQVLGDTYRGNGRWADAKACYLKVLDLVHEPAFRIRSAHVFGALADLDLRQGRLRAAASHWSKALAVTQDRETWGSLPLPLIGWVYIRLGEIFYEWNDLEAANDHVGQGLKRAELVDDAQTLLAGYLIAGRLKLTAGESTAADAFLERARPLIEQAPFPDWMGRFERLQLECWLAQGSLRVAVEWANGMLEGNAHGGQPASEEKQLAIARALIAKGDTPSLEQALALLRQLLQAAETEGRAGIQIEALALHALARWRRGEHASAMASLERALRQAKPEGYVRLFADFGLPMAQLLQEARSRAVMPEYVAKLLAACLGDHSVAAMASVSLPEPLSQREREVVKLIAAGLTNREIAETLIVSPETVKKHTGAIYSKLGVSNRTEAANKARELGLLD